MPIPLIEPHTRTKTSSPQHHRPRNRPPAPAHHPAAIIQRARAAPESLTRADVLQLQRTIGNRAVGQLLAEIGRVPSRQAPVQRQGGPEEECLQCAMTEAVQRQLDEEDEPFQRTFIDECVQCQIPEEEDGLAQKKGLTLQTKEEAPPNRTGMPDPLKAGVEALSVLDLSDVRVHYGSDQPTRLNALAYTQGTDIHIGPWQERHLPHEAWHVVQQMKGRVKPTLHAAGADINDDPGLEKEADVMGTKAMQLRATAHSPATPTTRSITSGPIQRSAKDVYKGGAELEYRNGTTELTFTNLPTTNKTDADKIKELIREGLKGIPISAIGNETSTELTGTDWGLTVETSIGTKVNENGKINIALELILGGPTGSTLEALKTAATQAATAVKALDNNNPLTFADAGNKIRDNVKSKTQKIDKAKAAITCQDSEPKYSGEDPLSKDWSGLTVTGSWDAKGTKPSESAWGLQVTLGVALADLHKVGAALKAKDLTDTSVAKPVMGDEDVWSAWDILKKMHHNKSLTENPLNEKELEDMFEKKHRHCYKWDNFDDVNSMESLKKTFNEEQTKNLHTALECQVRNDNTDNAAPSLATLNGLAKVIAAYVRGTLGSPDQGPKHTMMFVNKNPLQDVIANAAATMSAGNGDWYKRLRDACVDLILDKNSGTSVYRWNGAQDLELSKWGKKMKDDNVDLVALYDAAYRSSQIGGLTTLNDVSQLHGEKAKAPIIEFRDLGHKKPSEMKAVFEEIITKLEEK